MTTVDFDYLHRLLFSDAEAAWPLLVAYIRDHGVDANGQDLIEDVVFWHADQFIDRIEALVGTDATFREVVEQAHVGGVAGAGVDRFHALQDRLDTEWREPPSR